MKKNKGSDWDKLVKEQGWEKYENQEPRYSDMNVDERLDFIDNQLNDSYSEYLDVLTKVFTKIKRFVFYPKKYELKKYKLEEKLREIMTSIIHDTIRERELNLEKTKDVLQESYDRLPQRIKDKLELKDG